MPLILNFYSDVLCIWGWIGQHHNQTLLTRWSPSQVQWQYKLLELYGDVAARVKAQEKGEQAWHDYAAMSERLVSPIDGLSVHPDIWRHTRPTSSLMAHQAIKAVALCHGQSFANSFTDSVRSAFFAQARDISQFSVLREILRENHVQEDAVLAMMQSGAALAACVGEFRQAEKDKIPGSPCWAMDNLRYRLWGNIKPDIVVATVEQLITTQDNPA
ncbi:DsbA family oxidoreductase [Shewanella sp. GXUN23E]|uniref:DsbA family oxidoreductase n=1 Tax=Shewanella sp. GXUN23E TaxID=3422498 RepID=UPI003D7D4385